MPKLDVTWIGFSVYPPGASFGPYTVAGHELVWIAEGNTTLTTAAETYEAPAGTVILSRPGERNVYRWDPRGTTRHGYVLLAVAPADHRWPRLRRLDHDDVVLALLRHMLWLEAHRPDGWKDMARDALSYALRAFVTGASATGAPTEQELPAPIERSMAFVRGRWSDGPLRTPSLRELARAAAVTPEHLCRVYSRELGCGPVAALRFLRLGRASMLLGRSNVPVGEVARQTGFDNQFHFSRAFKSVFGVPPSDFRRGRRSEASLPAAMRRLAGYL